MLRKGTEKHSKVALVTAWKASQLWVCEKLTCACVDDLGTVGIKEGKQHQLALQAQQ